MYWPGGYFDYYEGHASAATTATGSHWILAEGALSVETYVLIANTSASPATAALRLMLEGSGPGSDVVTQVTVPANGRVSVPMSRFVGPGVRFGVEVTEVTSPLSNALVVEGALYWNANGEVWAAGASIPATRVP